MSNLYYRSCVSNINTILACMCIIVTLKSIKYVHTTSASSRFNCIQLLNEWEGNSKYIDSQITN
jgi:hypothetical protein